MAGGGGPRPRDLAASGGWLIAVGLVGFLVLAVVFEVVIGIGGRPVGSGGRYGLAVLLIGAGLVLLGRRLLGQAALSRSDEAVGGVGRRCR